MKRINEDIKNNTFQNLYLLYGEEDYLRNQYKNKLKKALLGEGDAMNLTCFEGKDLNQKAIVDLAETLPFFADKRVIVIENSGLFKGSADVIADYMKDVTETTFFVFAEAEIDKRNKLYKIIKDKGYISEFATQSEGTLLQWINQLVLKEGMTIERPAAALLLNKTGTDMENIRRELEKCICYCLNNGNISAKDVEAICTERLSNRIFDMIRFLSLGKREQAMKLYYDLIELKEPPMRILYLIARQFNLLLQTKQLKEKGFDQRTISDKMKLQPFIVGKNLEQASRFKTIVLRQALEDCVQSEEAVKTGKLSDLLSVELIIMKYSR